MVARRGRLAIVLGTLLSLALLLLTRQAPRSTAAASSEVPLSVSAGCPDGNALTGMCGTVAGFDGWYGSWKTAGTAGAFCLEHAKKEPLAGLAYARYDTAAGHLSMTAEDRARLGYLLGEYGATGDATRAAAIAILVHAAQGDTLTTTQLTSYPTTLPAAVRAAVLALWAEAGQDHGPYTAGLSVVADGAGAKATLTVRSSAGAPMAGFPVSWTGSSHGDEVTTTSDTGTATLTVGTVAPGNSVTAKAAVSGLPAADLAVWVPRDATVQSVAVALPTTSLHAAGAWTSALAPASLQVLKTTADPGYVSPAGAQFSVTNAAGTTVGTLVVDADGASNVVGGLDSTAGPFTVSETQPCPGCLAAPAQQASLAGGQAAVVNVDDAVAPVPLTITKQGIDGTGLAGAVLHLRRAETPGGPFDTDLGTCTSGSDGDCAVAGQSALPPADYQVTEDAPAPGTSWSTPRVQTVSLRAAPASVTFSDPRLTTVAFRKTDDADGSVVDRQHESLAGAVFAVSGPAGQMSTAGDASGELGRCTTGSDGTCSLPGTPLVEGVAYTWSEVAAPPGFALDASAHGFTACAAPCDSGTVTASDQGRYAHVTLLKHVAGEAGSAVSGATVDLCGIGLPDALAATFTAPDADACRSPAAWVATGVTDAHGGIDFGLLPPGARYCAVERTAPEGYLLSAAPVCGDLAAAGTLVDAAPAALALDLAEQRTPPPAPSAPPATAAPAAPTRVLPVLKAKPAAHPHPPRLPVVVVSQPRQPELAYTGAAHVGGALELGAGLISLGLALLSGASAARRRYPSTGR